MGQIQPKIQFIKRFWWIFTILGIGLLVFAFAAIKGHFHDIELQKQYDKQNYQNEQQNHPQEQEITNGQVVVNDYGTSARGEPTKAFNSSHLIAMENALSKGVKIEDAQNDWITTPDTLPEGEIDNENPYPLPWTDIRSVSFGADDEYMYFKFQFWGNFPRNPVAYEGDLINGGGAQVCQMTFGPGVHDWAQLQTTLSYMDEASTSKVAEMPRLIHEAMISPTGQRDEQLDDIYEKFTREGLIGGGADTDYLLTAYPMKLFGFKCGDTITFHLVSEFKSQKYHHVAKDYVLAVADPLAGHGERIKYVLCSNTYEKLGVPADAYKKKE
jgi:hypothetical protein